MSRHTHCLCHCGCGNSYPYQQMVHRKSSNEDLYIPHALDAWGLFRSPQEIRAKIETSGIFDTQYAFPGEIKWDVLFYHTYSLKQDLSETCWREEIDPVYGVYFVYEDGFMVPDELRLGSLEMAFSNAE